MKAQGFIYLTLIAEISQSLGTSSLVDISVHQVKLYVVKNVDWYSSVVLTLNVLDDMPNESR